MNNQDKIQEKAVQFQVLQNQLRGLEQRNQMLLQGVEELERTKLGLEDLKNSKGEAYIPVGANNFVLGEVKDNQNVLVSIGSGIAVKKKREDALEMTEHRIKDFKTEARNVAKQIGKMSEQLGKLQSDIETLRK